MVKCIKDNFNELHQLTPDIKLIICALMGVGGGGLQEAAN